MKNNLLIALIVLLSCPLSRAQTSFPKSSKEDREKIMSEAYWEIWNPEVQKKIDQDIEKHRKADVELTLTDYAPGTEVKIEQISHDFIFGAHIFNYNQLGKTEYNDRYKALYGTLFNSATVAFYWKTFEMEPDRPRFSEEYWDTEEYWNQVIEPELEPHWRRPATDPVVEFCESKKIRMHGHPIIWSAPEWHHPEWIFKQFCPEEEKKIINKLVKGDLAELTPSQIEELAPKYVNEINRLFEKRIVELAEYYKDRIHSWDVVNESRGDFHGNSLTGNKILRSRRAGILMPGDYTYHSFRIASRAFPDNVLLNINDNVLWSNEYYDIYINQIKDLLSNGIQIDILGSQMHLFNPQQCLDIALGKHIKTPEQTWEKMNKLSEVGLPIHISEVTITSPGDDERGRQIQAIIARNLYRLWFSTEKVMGITWWNVVDGCGAPRQTTVSGLFTRDMEPKTSFYALNELINEEWKTRMTVKATKEGIISFRGYKGRYRVNWKDKSGKMNQREFDLLKNGDGL
ncbi:MAG: endo-1,4-beta-xylanase [Fermentimonas sp.]